MNGSSTPKLGTYAIRNVLDSLATAPGPAASKIRIRLFFNAPEK